MDVLAGLNPKQKEAVQAIEGPALILAGPGSGKTRVITHRVAYLIKVCGINPQRIMAVTFTNKAAREMQERLEKLVPGSLGYLTLGTFHAICARILRREGRAAGIEPGFVIYDEDDQLNLVKRALPELNIDPKKFPPRAILSTISSAKSRMISARDYLGANRSYFDEVVGRVYERYQQLLAESRALDFDDLLMRTVALFREHPDVLGKFQERYVHVMVDEFQDTNTTQYELVKMLAGKYRNLCVVGDPDQSIYSWRYADVRNILNFEKDFPDAKVILLEQNYRSTKHILEIASHVIRSNRQRSAKDLWTENEPGDLTAVIETYTGEEEAQYVVKEIERIVDAGEAKMGDCAVLYRTNAQSRAIEEAFVRYGLPYKLVAGTRFYERREIKDIIAYLRLIQNPLDTVSLARVINVPPRGIGPHSFEELAAWARLQGISQYEALQRLAGPDSHEGITLSPRITKALANFGILLKGLIAAQKEMDLADFFDLVVAKTGYREFLLADSEGKDERWENVLELRTVAEGYRRMPPEEALEAFLEGIALVSDVDELQEDVDKVTLITLHQAKGLEFGVVFIVGVEEGLLPHFKSLDDPQQMEEERRLCYVGITRAKRKVYLVHAFRRNLMGRSTVNKPSRFLKDIPRNLVANGEVWAAAESNLGAEYKATKATPNLAPVVDLIEFKPGDRVTHLQFGQGIIVNCSPRSGDQEVTVAFEGVGLKKLLQSFAKLERATPA